MQTFLNLNSSDTEILYSLENDTVIKSLEKKVKYLIIYGPNKSGKTTIAKKFSINNQRKKTSTQFDQIFDILISYLVILMMTSFSRAMTPGKSFGNHYSFADKAPSIIYFTHKHFMSSNVFSHLALSLY